MHELDAFAQWIADEGAEIGGLPPIVTPMEIAPPTPVVGHKHDAYICGVYLLTSGGVVIYVGQSQNIYSRIAQHMSDAPFVFDAFFVEECGADERLSLEAQRIFEHNPQYNRMRPAYGEAPYRIVGAHFAGE